jgi:hypothetical protein
MCNYWQIADYQEAMRELASFNVINGSESGTQGFSIIDHSGEWYCLVITEVYKTALWPDNPLKISMQTMAIVFWTAVLIGKCVVGEQ